MGLSFYYNGKFNPRAELKEMIDEVEDVAGIYGWRCSIFETAFPGAELGLTTYNDKIYGICFTPPKCEPVWLCFLSNGRMSSPDKLRFYANSTGSQEAQYLYMLSTKTQYAGWQVHMVIMELLKYLKGKYFSELNIVDEGKYWETGEETVLRNIFNAYDALINGFAEVLEAYPAGKSESIEQYIQRMMEYLDKKRKKR